MARHSDERPHPIRNEQTWIGLTTIAGIAAGGFGLAQVEAIADQLPAAIGALASGGLLIQNTAVRKRAEKKVTPTSSPRDDDGNELVAISPQI